MSESQIKYVIHPTTCCRLYHQTGLPRANYSEIDIGRTRRSTIQNRIALTRLHRLKNIAELNFKKITDNKKRFGFL